MEFANPHILWLLAAIVPLTGYYVWRTMQGDATIRISSVEGLRHAPRTVRYYLRHVPFALRCIALATLIVALARPQSAEHDTRTDAEGIDIVLAIDISGSMLARDFKPDRITAAKEVAGSFVADRYGDRIGLVVFAGEAFTQSPLTTDQSSLQTLLSRIRSGVIEDGTAIGNGLATAINRLRESDAKSKVVILLTDGVNNRGEIAPLTAAAIAQDYGIKVYTIGVGTMGEAPYPVFDQRGNLVQTVNMKVEIDEEMLRKIARQTGGEYFRATDKQTLQSIYDRINSMEKSRVEVSEFTILHEEYLVWVLAALAALLLEFIVSRLILKRIP
ncbi:MAG: VWA domain-containing protein [Alistipes sp.]|nr:VWA domain-containing protein [Alistipes sp.]MBS6458532.1 VWA domain-containing protein [Alistipes sp.]